MRTASDAMANQLRARWEFASNGRQERQWGASTTGADLAVLEKLDNLIRNRQLTSHFQPIFTTADGSVFGFEALARQTGPSPFADSGELFRAANATGCLGVLDKLCLETALHCLAGTRFLDHCCYLFINICPETLMDQQLTSQIFGELVCGQGVPSERIILEITEESVISNYDLFRSALDSYRAQGFKIAIDDFGAGYAGLKMLSTVEPDFVKIDRHFIANIDRALIHANLVEAIATACNRIGIKIVAEGIERPEELAVIRSMGIDLVQGFLLGRPAPSLNLTPAPETASLTASGLPASHGERLFMGDIVTYVDPVAADDQIIVPFRRFLDQPGLALLPVVDHERVVGILNRSRFLEQQIIGSHGYGFAMNSQKRVADVMEQHLRLFDASCTIEEASKKINTKPDLAHNANLVVLKNGRYRGVVAINLLLDALTELNVLLAKDSNPLSGLPGNNAIRREISRRLAQNMLFDVLYIDIDHFKPFNDHYSFEKGDTVISSLARIVSGCLELDGNPFNFAGHISGDDFIAITRPSASLSLAERLIDQFSLLLPALHGPADHSAGHYLAPNRQGQTEWFPLLSLSIAIVSTEVYSFDSYPQLASIACEVKKAAKRQAGSSIARDQRMLR